MKKPLFVLLILSISFFCICKSVRITNSQPFSKSSRYETPSSKKSSIWRTFVKYQRKGNRILNRNIRSLKDNFGLKTLTWLFLFSFLYGVFHAIGPGHGKVLVGLYFLHKKAKLIDAGKISITIAFTHTGLALLLAILFQTILSNIKGMQRIQVQSYFSFASGILIVLVGFWFLYTRVKKNETLLINENIQIDKNIYAVGISAGINPCPVSLTIMLIAITSGLFFVGLAAVIAMSIGLSLVLFVIGLLMIKSRERILYRLKDNSKLMKKLNNIHSYAGIFAIILLGLSITFVYFPSYLLVR